MFRKLLASQLIFLLLGSHRCVAVPPATVAEAVGRLDLVTLPLPEGATVPGYRREAELSYRVKLSTNEAFSFVDRQLVDRGWKQMPDAQIHGEFANANYALDGFTVYLSVSPRQPGEVGVMLTHKGNIRLEDLPVPDDVEAMYSFPAVVMYKSSRSVDEAVEACRAKMISAGWSPYGGAGDTHYFRKNAVQVDINVMSAPAQGGATVISVTGKLLSRELPAPPFTENFRYSDGTTAIDFDTAKSPAEVADFYREQLGPLGWKATTKEPVAIKWKRYTIFRNSGQEMITIATHDFEGQTRVHLDHQNVAEVAQDELREKIAFGEKAKYRDQPWVNVRLDLPEDVKPTRLQEWALKVSTSRERPFALAEQLVASLHAAGWKLDPGKTADQPVFRTYRLEREDRVLSILAFQHDKLASWVAIAGIGGVKLELAH